MCKNKCSGRVLLFIFYLILAHRQSTCIGSQKKPTISVEHQSSVLYLVLYARATNSEQRGRVQTSRLKASGGKRRRLCAQIGAHIAACAQSCAVAGVRGERRLQQRSKFFFLVADRRMLIVRARKAEKMRVAIAAVAQAAAISKQGERAAFDRKTCKRRSASNSRRKHAEYRRKAATSSFILFSRDHDQIDWPPRNKRDNESLRVSPLIESPPCRAVAN